MSQLTLWVVGGYAIWQGEGLIRGGPERLAGPSFAVLRRTPEPNLFWGWWLVVAGLLVLAGSALQRAKDPDVQLAGLVFSKGLGLAAMAVWSFCFAKGGLDAAAAVPTAATTGGRTYVLLGVWLLLLLLVDERRGRRNVRS